MRVCILFIMIMAMACETPTTNKPLVYEGPLKKAENIVMHYSEKNALKVLLTAKKLNEFENGDKEFPEGVDIQFYDQWGQMTSTLHANHAYFFKKENKWRGRGKVEVTNIGKAQQMKTEELFWRPDTKKIFTDKFVTVTDKADVIYGNGLVADQDLSNYVIKDTSGMVDVNE